ncbi:MAG: zinc-ribbon domain-containing protein [Patescibacteria group bacterium]|nr:zinc-ribbon domain-containing protein [Patescibacteria group bacterium]
MSDQNEIDSNVPLQDKQIICAKCAKPFIWTAAEQKYYQQKGLKHEPKLCLDCRKERKDMAPKEITCLKCGRHGHVKGEVPSLKGYCEPCFEIIKKEK